MLHAPVGVPRGPLPALPWDGALGGVRQDAPVGTRVVLVAQLELVARGDLTHVLDLFAQHIIVCYDKGEIFRLMFFTIKTEPAVIS